MGEEWRKNADTTKMSPEEVKRAGVEGSKRPPGGVLHQRRNFPFSPVTMALAGLLIVGTTAYIALYAKKKPEATAVDVAKVTTGTARPEDTRPRK